MILLIKMRKNIAITNSLSQNKYTNGNKSNKNLTRQGRYTKFSPTKFRQPFLFCQQKQLSKNQKPHFELQSLNKINQRNLLKDLFIKFKGDKVQNIQEIKLKKRNQIQFGKKKSLDGSISPLARTLSFKSKEEEGHDYSFEGGHKPVKLGDNFKKDKFKKNETNKDLIKEVAENIKKICISIKQCVYSLQYDLNMYLNSPQKQDGNKININQILQEFNEQIEKKAIEINNLIQSSYYFKMDCETLKNINMNKMIETKEGIDISIRSEKQEQNLFKSFQHQNSFQLIKNLSQEYFKAEKIIGQTQDVSKSLHIKEKQSKDKVHQKEHISNSQSAENIDKFQQKLKGIDQVMNKIKGLINHHQNHDPNLKIKPLFD